MVNYCTMALNNSLQDALTSSVYLLNEKEQQILQMENKIETLYSELFAYREKHSHGTSIDKRHVEEKCKYRKYSTLVHAILVCSSSINPNSVDLQCIHIIHFVLYVLKNNWAHFAILVWTNIWSFRPITTAQIWCQNHHSTIQFFFFHCTYTTASDNSQ